MQKATEMGRVLSVERRKQETEEVKLELKGKNLVLIQGKNVGIIICACFAEVLLQITQQGLIWVTGD